MAHFAVNGLDIGVDLPSVRIRVYPYSLVGSCVGLDMRTRILFRVLVLTVSVRNFVRGTFLLFVKL